MSSYLQSRRLRVLSVVFLLIAVLSLCGCERAINRAAERRIRDALPTTLGPARAYRVHIANAPENTVAGHLNSVTVDGDDVQLSNGLLVDQLHLELSGVDVDTDHGRVRSIQSAHFSATIGQKTLDEIMAGEEPEGETLRKIHVLLADRNMVTLSAERVVLGLGVPFRLTGPLRVAGPQRIEIDPNRLIVIGIPITGVVLKFVKQHFEHSVDLSALPFPIEVTEVRTTPGQLTLIGTANMSAFLQQVQKKER